MDPLAVSNQKPGSALKRKLQRKIVEFDAYFCDNCRKYAYNEASGDPAHEIHRGTQVENLPDSWRCPHCGATSEQLRPCTMVDGFSYHLHDA